MHELAYVTELYKRLVKENKTITDVYLTVSYSSGIEIDSFIFYWNTIVAGTTVHQATLHITKTPQILTCTQCKTTFTSLEDDSTLLPCPGCASHKTVSTGYPSVTIEKLTYETNKENP